MYLRKGLKISASCLIISAFIVCLSFPFFVSAYPSLADPDYTYYGVVPSKIYEYILNDMNDPNSGWSLDNGTIVTASPLLNGMTVATKALLAMAASEDGTTYEVDDLTSDTILAQGTLASMEKILVLVDNGTIFKVVSNNQVSVLLLNYQTSPAAGATEGPTLHTFYTDVNGLYVGTEFVLMASSFSYFSVNQNGFYTILAVEKSTVTVTRDDGDSHTYNIDANSYQNILLTSFRIYKFESTGNIMIQSAVVPVTANSGEGMGEVSCFPVPSVEGGFVGTFFLTKATKSGWDTNRDYGYRIEALENAKVKVFDLETKQPMNEYSVEGGTGISIQPQAYAIAVQSDTPITLTLIHNSSIEQSRPLAGNKGGEYSGYGNGVMFIGIQPNEETMIYLPIHAHDEAYFFVSEDTQLTIDGEARTVHADSPLLYTVLGTHTVQSDKNVVLQINFWPDEPDYQGLWFTGTAIPSIETVGDNPTVTITPLEGGGFPTTYIIIGGGAAAAVVVVVVLVMMRKRGSKPS